MFQAIQPDQYIEIPFPLSPDLVTFSVTGRISATLQWQSESNRVYRVERATSPGHPFAVVDIENATPPLNTYNVNTLSNETAIYRILVER